MNLQKHVIIINGVNKTYQVESIRLDGYKYAVKFQNADKVYSYSGDKVIWLTNPLSVEFEGCHVFVNGKKEKNIKYNGERYVLVRSGTGTTIPLLSCSGTDPMIPLLATFGTGL